MPILVGPKKGFDKINHLIKLNRPIAVITGNDRITISLIPTLLREEISITAIIVPF